MSSVQDKSWKAKIKTDVEFAFANKKNFTPHAYIDIAGDLIAGTLLTQILYWCGEDEGGHGKLKVFRDGHYWLAKGRDDWYEEVRVTPRQYDTAISKLKGEIKEKGKGVGIDETKRLVEVKVFKFGGVPTTHIRPIYENINREIDRWKKDISLSMEKEVSNGSQNSEIPNSQNGDFQNLQNGEKEITNPGNDIHSIYNIDSNITENTYREYRECFVQGQSNRRECFFS